jgi:hypothetical protein
MKVTIFILSMTIIFSGCGRDKSLDINNGCIFLAWSIDNVPWIVELKKTVKNGPCGPGGQCQASLVEGTYYGQVVFYMAVGGALCDTAGDTPTLYNCEGKIIKVFTISAADQKELYSKVTRDRVLYNCND